MGAPRLAPGTPFQKRKGTDDLRTVTRTEPRRPISKWHSGTRWWARHHLDREPDGEWADESGWGAERRAPVRVRARGLDRESRRENLRLASHAQDLRAEAVTMGGREETARYYGTGEWSVSGGGAERRVRVTARPRTRTPNTNGSRLRDTRAGAAGRPRCAATARI